MRAHRPYELVLRRTQEVQHARIARETRLKRGLLQIAGCAIDQPFGLCPVLGRHRPPDSACVVAPRISLRSQVGMRPRQD
jgi:hypothetical protein